MKLVFVWLFLCSIPLDNASVFVYNEIKEYNSIVYYYLRNLQGDVIAIYDTLGNKKVEYAYDAWGNCTVIYAADLAFANANPIRYRGYYFDRETGLYYLNARYYNPEWRRFISPANTTALNANIVNGLNLYSYENNNPIGNLKASVSVAKRLNGFEFSNFLSMTSSLPKLVKSNNNSWDPHWTNVWLDSDGLGFLTLTKEGLEIVNYGLSIYKGSFYFDKNENHSYYLSVGNIGVYAGLNYKEGIGISVGGNVLEIGYDGRVVDASIEGLSVGITYMYKDGELEFGFGAGWIGWSISIDLIELCKLLFGGE